MAFDAAAWANPNQFSDISRYTGLDTKQGMTSVMDAMKQSMTGAAPPPSGADEPSFGQQIMGAVAPNLQKYTSAAGEVGQGNFSGAANTLGIKNPLKTLAQLPALGQPVGYGMSHQFED